MRRSSFTLIAIALTICLTFAQESALGQTSAVKAPPSELARMLTDYVGQKFESALFGGKQLMVLKKVNSEFVQFAVQSNEGTFDFIIPLSTLTHVLIFQKLGDTKKYIYRITFPGRDFDATPWPPRD